MAADNLIETFIETAGNTLQTHTGPGGRTWAKLTGDGSWVNLVAMTGNQFRVAAQGNTVYGDNTAVFTNGYTECHARNLGDISGDGNAAIGLVARQDPTGLGGIHCWIGGSGAAYNDDFASTDGNGDITPDLDTTTRYIYFSFNAGFATVWVNGYPSIYNHATVQTGSGRVGVVLLQANIAAGNTAGTAIESFNAGSAPQSLTMSAADAASKSVKSPANWDGATKAIATGAYRRFRFTSSRRFSLTFTADIFDIVGMGPREVPVVRLKLSDDDGVTWNWVSEGDWIGSGLVGGRYQLRVVPTASGGVFRLDYAPGIKGIALGDAGSSLALSQLDPTKTYQIECHFVTPGTVTGAEGDRWDGDPPPQTIQFNTVEIDNGGSFLTLSARQFSLIVFGDSTSECANGLQNGQPFDSNDCTLGTAAVFAEQLEALIPGSHWEYGSVAYGGQGINQGGSGNVPTALNAYNLLYAGHARADDSPSLVISLHGRNGVNTQPNCETFQTDLRGLYPDSRILIGTGAEPDECAPQTFQDAFDALAMSNAFFMLNSSDWVNGSQTGAGTWDGVHPKSTAIPYWVAELIAYGQTQGAFDGLGTIVTGVSVSATSVFVGINRTRQLTATVSGTGGTPSQAVTWSVESGEGSVDANGLFTAGGDEGLSVVRAASVQDNAFYGEITLHTVAGGSGGGASSKSRTGKPANGPARLSRAIQVARRVKG